MDIPISILYLYFGMAMTIGILGITLGIKKVAGSPFITIFAGIMLFGMIALIQNIEVGYGDDTVRYTLDYPMNVTTGSTGIALTSTFVGVSEHPANTNSLLYNQPISCITLTLSKTGSPTGTATIGIFGGAGLLIKSFGTLDVSTIPTTSQKNYEFCLPSHDYWSISLYEYVGIMYTNGGASTINVIRHTSDTFDGINSVRSLLSSGSWADTTTDDVRMILTYEKPDIKHEAILYPFVENDIWVFTAVLSFFFTYMGVMLQFSKWHI